MAAMASAESKEPPHCQHHLMCRYCNAGAMTSAGVPMAAKKAPPLVRSAAVARPPQVTARSRELERVAWAAPKRAALVAGSRETWAELPAMMLVVATPRKANSCSRQACGASQLLKW